MNTRIKIVSGVFGGFLFGLGIIVGIGIYNSKNDAGRPLIGPKILGDIRISRLINRENEYQALILERNGKQLLLINQSLSGETNTLALYNGKDIYPKVLMNVDPNTKEWDCLKYGTMDKGGEPREGCVVLDIDVDGQSDLFFFYNKNAVAQGIYALINNEWKYVTFLDFNEKYIKVDKKPEKIPMGTSLRGSYLDPPKNK